MTWGFISLILIAILHGIAVISSLVGKNYPMAIAMAAFVVSDIAFAWMLK